MRIAAPLNSEPVPVLQWIEVASAFQIPNFQIVGLPSPEVAEARERVRLAIHSSGFQFPKRKVVVNLSPASIKKRGTGLDLGISLSVLTAHSDLECFKKDTKLVAWGELGLDGTVKPCGQITRTLYASWKARIPYLLIPECESDEANRKLYWISESGEFADPPPALIPVSNLADAWNRIQRLDEFSFQPVSFAELKDQINEENKNLAELLPLSASLERAICVSAVGNHHLLLIGSKGTGKSHAAEWRIALDPPVSRQMRLIQSLYSELSGTPGPKENSAPVRRISPYVRPFSLIGRSSGSFVRPGEFSLAHGGLLVADELPEWPRDSIEALREPLESGSVTLTRAQSSHELPARFTLLANGNLCPCGGWPKIYPLPQTDCSNSVPHCKCPRRATITYLNRISGPVLDRIDMTVLVPPQNPSSHSGVKGQDRVRVLKERIQKIRQISLSRFGKLPSSFTGSEIEDLIAANPAWNTHLSKLNSLRSRHKTVRLALTLALWDGNLKPTAGHFYEVSLYRPERLGLLA